MLSLRYAAPLAIALLAALPGVASAATFCVHQPGDPCGPGQIDKGVDLQGALNDALGGGPDDVLVGPGVFTGPFSYGGLAAANIRGVGDATVLRAPNANGTTVLDLSSAASTVSNVRIDVPVGNNAASNFGLRLRGTASGVNVAIASNLTDDTYGVELSGGSFRGGSVTGPMEIFATALATDQQAHAVVQDARLQAYRAVTARGAATIRRVDAMARTGFSVLADNPGDGSFLIEDSVWRTPPGATEALGIEAACGQNADVDLTARNLTLVNRGTDQFFNYTVAAVCQVGGQSAAVDLSSSIVLGGATSLRALANGGPATIDVAYSDYDPSKTEIVGATAAITTGPGNVNVAPGFAGPGNFRLLRGSPLVDAGDPAGLAAGESATDLDGAPRIANPNGLGVARRDIGAFELQPLPPVQPPGTGPGSDVVAPVIRRLRVQPRRFRVARRAKRRATASRGTKIRFRLSERATVRLRMQRALPGRRARGRCRKPTARLRRARRCTRYRGVGMITKRGRPSGANTVAFSGRFGRRALRPGPYRVLAQAIDPSGNRSRPRVARFRVLKPARR